MCAQLYFFILYLGEWGVGGKNLGIFHPLKYCIKSHFHGDIIVFVLSHLFIILVVLELDFNYCIGCFAGTEPYCRS